MAFSGTARSSDPSWTRMLLPLGFAVVAFGFQQTAVVPAMPLIQEELQASHAWSAWLLSGYLAASAVFTPLLGKLGDRYGQKRVLVWSLVVFLVGSLGAGLAPSFPVLVLCRAVQGAGGSVFPLTLAIAQQHLPDRQVGVGISLLTGGFGVGTALGFGCSGPLVAVGSWRWIFAAGSAALVLALVLVLAGTPRSPVRQVGRLGLPGAALLAGGLVLLLVALTEGESLGWASTPVASAFVLAIVLLAGWVWWDARATAPLLNLRTLAARPVLLTNLATIGFGFVLFGVYFLVPFRVEEVRAASPGLFLLPAAVGQMLLGPITPAAARLLTPRWTFTAGLMLSTAGALGAALVPDMPVLVLVWTFLVGCGAGISIAVTSTIAARSAPGGQVGVATALNSVLRRVGGGIGGQSVAAVLSAGGAEALPMAFGWCVAAGGLAVLLSLGITSGTRSTP